MTQSFFARQLAIYASYHRDPRNRATFLSLLQQPRIVHELRRMNQYGILGRYLPAFRRIVLGNRSRISAACS